MIAPERAVSTATFSSLLECVRGDVDARLARWLGPRVAQALEISAEVGAAASAIERLALRGGKRMRAALVVAGFEACTKESERSLDALFQTVAGATLAIELLQVYLLIHDDWMDDDEVRRGGPAVHVMLRDRLGSVRLGDAAAVLAGDLACAYAQSALLDVDAPADRVVGAMRALASIQEDVVRGQLAEMTSLASSSGGPKPPLERVFELKTASYTVTGPLVLGARLAGASDAAVTALTAYGKPLGVAFQLRDDLLGVYGDARTTGKPVGNDIRQGKRTALIAEVTGDAVPLVERVLGRQDASDADVASVAEALVACGAKARVEARVRALLADARSALATLPLAETSRGYAWLLGGLQALGERTS
jgi:geranylgeranyl diphosphate synthase type I